MGYKRYRHIILPCKLGGPYSSQYGIVADEVALGLASLRVLRSSPVIVVPPVLHTHISTDWSLKKDTACFICEAGYEVL